MNNISLPSLAHLGSFHGVCAANTDMVKWFKEAERIKNPKIPFVSVRKIAIEAPAETLFTINDIEIKMPSTGIFELGLDYIQIYTLTFKDDVDVNIVYMY